MTRGIDIKISGESILADVKHQLFTQIQQNLPQINFLIFKWTYPVEYCFKNFNIFISLHKSNQREFLIMISFWLFISQSNISARYFIWSLFHYPSFAPLPSNMQLLFRKTNLQVCQIISITSPLYSLIEFLFQIDKKVLESLNQALIYLLSLSLSFVQDSKISHSPFTILRKPFLPINIQAYFYHASYEQHSFSFINSYYLGIFQSIWKLQVQDLNQLSQVENQLVSLFWISH